MTPEQVRELRDHIGPERIIYPDTAELSRSLVRSLCDSWLAMEVAVRAWYDSRWFGIEGTPVAETRAALNLLSPAASPDEGETEKAALESSRERFYADENAAHYAKADRPREDSL